MEQSIEKGTYEVIRERLNGQKQLLAKSVGELNTKRKEIFGGVDFQLISSVRITTEHNCLARDIIAIGDLCLFGYNVRLGLKTLLEVDDVFSVYRFTDNEFVPGDAAILADATFSQELQNLYKYYRHTRFSRFHRSGDFLYFIFQLSDSASDIKAFKWHVDGNKLTFIDSRSVGEINFPRQHEFEWVKATRDMQRTGRKPHVSLADKVFIQTIGGKLTVKVEDNTDDGRGIYAEAIEQHDQSLDDADISFCDLGNLVIIRVKPYLESFRYFIFNNRTKKVVRADSVRDAVVLLPDNQGVLVSNGYYLQTGESKLFDRKIDGVKFLKRLASPNGEDFMYIFYEEQKHDFVLLSYNIINQSVQNPIICNGYAFFKDGEIGYFNTESEPTRHHLLQVWQTPYAAEFIPDSKFLDNPLYKIGNQAIVRATAEIQELNVLINKEDTYEGLYEDISSKSQSILDAYFWLQNTNEATAIVKPLKEIKKIALAAIDEFEKVKEVRKNTSKAFKEVQDKADSALAASRTADFDSLDEYVSLLTKMRVLRGEIIALKNLRYVDVNAVDALDLAIANRADDLAKACVSFLLKDNALLYYQKEMQRLEVLVNEATKVIETREIEKDFDGLAQQLEMLIDIVNNLKIEDTAHSTKIIENITLIFSQLNQQKVALRNKRKQLSERESVADFKAQMTLFEQSISNYLDLATTPERCDEYLTKLSLQLEEMESRFADFDEFIDKIGEKREAVYAAFEAQKVSLTEARNRSAMSLLNSATRILKAVQNKAATFDSEAEINGYFAGDLMVDRVRDAAKRLEALEDQAKAEDLLNQLNVLQQEAIRSLKDRKELYEDGNAVIRMGSHRFAVNKQNLDLSLLVRDQNYHYHLTGTSYFEPITHDSLTAYRDLWEQQLPSENRIVQRAEFLAWQVYAQLDRSHAYSEGQLKAAVDAYMGSNYGEGYVKGVHDFDAVLLLRTLIEKRRFLGLLRYNGSVRALAVFAWFFFDEEKQQFLKHQIQSLRMLRNSFANPVRAEGLIADIANALATFFQKIGFETTISFEEAAHYLSEEANLHHFTISREANDFIQAFDIALKEKQAAVQFEEIREVLVSHPMAVWNHCLKWAGSFATERPLSTDHALREVVAFLVTRNYNTADITHVAVSEKLEKVKSLGKDGVYVFDFHDFVKRLSQFTTHDVPRFKKLQQLKHQLIEDKRKALRLHELQTQVLSSFVRNKLINDVYFPLIGANFAKQLGAYGSEKRSDRSGMLLLISPPGYGKTTLMEYVSERLGLIFMKINGPSIGHEVTALDPSQAPNAGARQELEKLNLSFEMADNVMLYLDDIQHCNTEFLQKFISLADGQRKIEGVYKGASKTYDLRGKRFCVVMAGNPYTETGEKFQIPDMLSNRADIYNLGETASNRRNLFDLSMVENSVSSNSYLQRLTQSSMSNLYAVVDAVEKGVQDIGSIEGNLSAQELNDCRSVVEKVVQARNVVLAVNAQYIASAAMADAYREEPPFKLQGSYRDMNKIVSMIVPILKEEEVTQILLDHYQNESQTLTSEAEANLLKLKELMGILNDAEAKRWASIKSTFQKNKVLKGFGTQDKMVQVLAQLTQFNDGLEGIRRALVQENPIELKPIKE